MPMETERKMACFILKRAYFLSPLLYDLLITGSKACEIAPVKKEGSSTIGRTNPLIIPYSSTI